MNKRIVVSLTGLSVYYYIQRMYTEFPKASLRLNMRDHRLILVGSLHKESIDGLKGRS
jgi:hypothetical protein